MIDNNEQSTEVNTTPNNNLGVNNVPEFKEALGGEKINCPNCGTENDIANMRCIKCDAPLFENITVKNNGVTVHMINPASVESLFKVMIPVSLVFIIPGIFLVRKGLQPGEGMLGNTPFIASGIGFIAIGSYALYLAFKYKKEHFDKKDSNEDKDNTDNSNNINNN